MQAVVWIVIGLILGAGFRTVLPCPRVGGITMAIGIGVIAAIVGGWMAMIGVQDVHMNDISAASSFAAVAAGLAALLAFRGWSLRYEPSNLIRMKSLP